MLDMENPLFCVAHVMFRVATCASRCSKVGHSTIHCGLKATIKSQPVEYSKRDERMLHILDEGSCRRYQAISCVNLLMCLSLETPGEG